MAGRNMDTRTLVQDAVGRVRDCAVQMEASASDLLAQLPHVRMDEALRADATGSTATLKDTAGRALFELALLQAEFGQGAADVGSVLRTLSGVDATMMEALAAFTDLVDRLEGAAERDEANERAFVLVIEAAGLMMQRLERAKAATQALRALLPASGRADNGRPTR